MLSRKGAELCAEGKTLVKGWDRVACFEVWAGVCFGCGVELEVGGGRK